MCPFPSSRNQPSGFRRSIESRIGFPGTFFLIGTKCRRALHLASFQAVKKNFHLEGGGSVERDATMIVGNFSSLIGIHSPSQILESNN